MKLRNSISIVAALLLTLATGCGSDGSKSQADAGTADSGTPASLAATILPGFGVLSGEASLNLGDSLTQMKEALGEPSRLRTLGVVGTMFDYPSRGLNGLYS